MKNLMKILFILCLSLVFVSCGSESKEITADEVTKSLSSGGVELDYATYEVIEKKKEKTLKVTVAYTEEVMIVGKVTGIRNIVDSSFSKDYPKIDLTIIQEDPKFSSVNYIFEDGVWDKDVE